MRKHSCHAEGRGRRYAALAATGTGLVVAAAAASSVAVARQVVVPRHSPHYDTVVTAADAGTITLTDTPDTRLEGRYGLRLRSGRYLQMGEVRHLDDRSVTRTLLSRSGPAVALGPASFSGWFYHRPEQLGLPFEDVTVPTALGPAPAWLFPAADDGERWAILIHGRGVTRQEVLRAVPVFADAGLTVLVVSYRNDGEAPASPDARYGLGLTEWADVDAALAFARAHHAERTVLMGWSMGGAIALQTSLRSPRAHMIDSMVLDSPVIDWQDVLTWQAQTAHIPTSIRDAAFGLLTSRLVRPATGRSGPMDFHALNWVANSAILRHPILLMHSTDDAFVPAGPSSALAERRPDLVRYEEFHGARHTKLWNMFPNRWAGAITDWLGSRDRSS